MFCFKAEAAWLLLSDPLPLKRGNAGSKNSGWLTRLGDPDTAARIQACEMAYKLQQSVSELTNLADGGIQAGHVHGKTDDCCFNAVEDPVHVHGKLVKGILAQPVMRDDRGRRWLA